MAEKVIDDKYLMIDAIKSEYPGINEQGIAAIMGNVELESGGGKAGRERPYTLEKIYKKHTKASAAKWNKLNPKKTPTSAGKYVQNIVTIRENVEALGFGNPKDLSKEKKKEWNDKLKQNPGSIIGAMYMQDFKATWAGGSGPLQLTIANYGGNKKKAIALKQFAKDQGMEFNDYMEKFSSDPAFGLKETLKYYKSTEETAWTTESLNATDAQTLGDTVINPHRKHLNDEKWQAYQTAGNDSITDYNTNYLPTIIETEEKDDPWKTWDKVKVDLDKIKEKDDPWKAWDKVKIDLDKIISDKKIEAENKKLKEEKEKKEIYSETDDAITIPTFEEIRARNAKGEASFFNRGPDGELLDEGYTMDGLGNVIWVGEGRDPNDDVFWAKVEAGIIDKNGFPLNVETEDVEAEDVETEDVETEDVETVDSGPDSSEPYQKDGRLYVMKDGVETLYQKKESLITLPAQEAELIPTPTPAEPVIAPKATLDENEVDDKTVNVVEKQQLEKNISTVETEEMEVLDANGNIKKITVPIIKPVEPVLTNVDADSDSIPDGIDIDGGTDSNIPPPGVETAVIEKKPKLIKPRMRDFLNSSRYMKARREYYKNVEGEKNPVDDNELNDEEIKEAVDMEQNAKTIDASKRNIFKTNGKSNIFNTIIGDVNTILLGVEREIQKFTKSLNNKE